MAAIRTRLSSPVEIRLRRSPQMSIAGLEDLADALAGLGADRHDRREVEERHLVADPLDVLVEGPVGLLGDEVPLVDRDDEALALLDDVARDVGVLRGQALDGVDDEDGDVRARQRVQRADRRVALGRRARRDLAAPPDPGRVDQHDLAAAPGQPRVDRVAGRARDLRHDRPVLAEQRVEQARLADVRAGRRTRSRPARRPSRRPSPRPSAPPRRRRRRGRGLRSPSPSAESPASGSPTTNGSRWPAATSSAHASASASLALRASSASLSGGSAQTIASSRSPVPRPCDAEMA